MTKPWLHEQNSVLAPPAPLHLGEHHGRHLDFHRNAQQQRCCPGGVTQKPPAKPLHPGPPVPQYPTGVETPGARPGRFSRTGTFMDKPAPPDKSCLQDAAQTNVTQDAWNSDQEKKTNGGKKKKKKNYQRYPKPPYSYLAMIAMVIQRSPEKKLTLSEILREISTLFPFFKGSYKGWQDSVRHNLSSYNCFIKVLKDPGKPQGKGNFWSVELSRIPLELLKRQNTAVSRQDETIFAQDLAPYILHGQTHAPPSDPLMCLPLLGSRNPSPPQEDLFRPKLDSSFAIDSLLHSLRPADASEDVGTASKGCWGQADHHQPPPPLQPHYASSTRSASASSISPASTSSSSDDEWKGVPHSGKRLPPDGKAASDCSDYKPPLHKSARRETVTPPWELPTSYTKYAPPNAIAPPSMRFNGGPLVPLHGGLPLYGYGSSPVAPGHFLGHTYWPLLHSRRVSVQAPPLFLDLENMLQSVPPNKSVFDVLIPPNQNSLSPHETSSQYAMQNRPPVNRYPQY
ncbi:forkhead box protein H1-like [Thalassophryne amazonica]|uniref:forkhead box protein H1-like n=1 Tax=Thalassophryne amazonica TaxID=390379 RepID=UPI001470F91E|nr:forkhead box protein H1-like [Thalassophryne amazonica]